MESPSTALEPQSVRSVSIVIPVYNSERTIGALVDELAALFTQKFQTLQIVLVNDGSRDASHRIINETCRRHPGLITYVRLMRNFGEHNAVMCGLRHAACDSVVIMDDDFQNPPSEALKLISKLEEGHDVVYSRYLTKRHGLFRNLGSWFNNRLACWVLGKPRNLYLSSFKAMTLTLARLVTMYDGPFPYLDGLILKYTCAIGVQDTEHAVRREGSSNYNLPRLVRVLLNMATIGSLLPLRLASVAGITMALFGFSLGAFFIISHQVGGVLLKQSIPPGWASLITCITVFAGMQLLLMGILGEYLGRLYILQNKIPQYAIRSVNHAALNPSAQRTDATRAA